MADAVAHLGENELWNNGYQDVEQQLADFNDDNGTEYELSEVTFEIHSSVAVVHGQQIDACNIEEMIRLIDEVEEDGAYQAAIIYFLESTADDLEDITREKLDSVEVFDGTATRAAYDEVTAKYGNDDDIREYFDVDRLAQDRIDNGEWEEIETDYGTMTILNREAL